MTKWESENRGARERERGGEKGGRGREEGERENVYVYSTLGKLFEKQYPLSRTSCTSDHPTTDSIFPLSVSSFRKRILSADFVHKTLLWPGVSSFDA